jgi:2-dehydro-3-deoxyphosphooctonate aldolase (KDO 8-P synthase)
MIRIDDIEIGDNNPLVLIAGPCVVENEKIIMETAESLSNISAELRIPLLFKSSYRKANRSSYNSFSGIGDEAALRILEKVKAEFRVPVVTDIHLPAEAKFAAGVADVLQIPAFLCRQTELLTAAGNTGKIVNIKKGQFAAPEDMSDAAQKVLSTGNNKILLTERGTTFGYHNLVVDMRSLVIMRESGFPVVMDATHAVQIPGKGGVSGGQPEFIKPLAKAAVAIGIDALFLEVHPDPANALSDAASQFPLNQLKDFLKVIKEIDSIAKRI